MMLTLHLTPAEETKLRVRAAKRGQGLESYLHYVVHQEVRREDPSDDPKPGESLAEALQGFIGVLDSSARNGEQVSHVAENSEEEFGKALVEKYRAQGLTFRDENSAVRLADGSALEVVP